MGNLYEYFSAADDQAAATALDLGPAGLQKAFDVLSTTGIDPAVQIGTLEELLTGRSFDDILQDPRASEPLGPATSEDEHGVVTLTDQLLDALAGADRASLADVAVPWSETEEFWGQADPGILTDFLVEFAALAKRAKERGHKLYCWWSL